MSFFFRESFTLPNYMFQDGLTHSLAGAGSFAQDGSYGYLRTFAAADCVIYASHDSLIPSAFVNKTIRWTIRYQVQSLSASGVFYTLYVCQAPNQPVIGALGSLRVCAYIYNSAGTFYERWAYLDANAAAQYWNGSGWNTTATNNVRGISLNTWYTVTIIYHPYTRNFTILNDAGGTATTTITARNADPYWWWGGDCSASAYYGQLRLNYIYIDDVTIQKSWAIRNSFTLAFKKSQFVKLINDLTTSFKVSLALKNNILNYNTFRESLSALNRIGVEVELVLLDGVPTTQAIKGRYFQNVAHIFIDGEDVSRHVESWSIEYDDNMISKNVLIVIKDNSFAERIAPYDYRDTRFGNTRIEVMIDGHLLGSFFLEKKKENRDSKSSSVEFSGLSKTASLDIPFSPSSQYLLESNSVKYGIVSSLALSKGISLAWGMSDSILYAGGLTVDERSPMEVIQEIVEAGGGKLITNRYDDLKCYYKEYETNGQVPILEITSSDIISYSCERVIPSGENTVEVSGYEDMSVTGGWSKIVLTSSKTKLNSNGYDTAVLTAQCWNPDGTIPSVDLINDEEQTPSQNDHYEISTSRMIDKDGGGIVEIRKKSSGVVIPGPYDILSDSQTIRVRTALANETFRITYWGGETVSFSVDQLADVLDSEVLIRDGIARTTIKAGAGGGGFAVVSANFSDAQPAKISIQIADPRVGSLDVTADPSSIDPNKTSKIKVRVYDSEGFAAQNGLTLFFFIEKGNGHFNQAGTLQSTTAPTRVETIVDGSLESPIYSSSETEVNTQYPMTALTSIYRIEKGTLYTGTNYAIGATISRNTATLSTPLPYPDTPLVITYNSSGMAQVMFYAPTHVPYEGETDWIRVYCGEYGSCRVEIRSPGSGDSGADNLPSEKNTLNWLVFRCSGIKPSGGTGQMIFNEYIQWPDPHLEPIVYTDREVDIQVSGGHSMGITYTVVSYESLTKVTLKMQANRITGTSHDCKNVDGTISGKRIVEDADTLKPIPNVGVIIAWDGVKTFAGDGAENCGYTSDNGEFIFTRGKPGSFPIKFTSTTYGTDTSQMINVPGNTSNVNVDADYNFDTLKFEIKVPYAHRKID